jgi:hypothetical protein
MKKIPCNIQTCSPLMITSVLPYPCIGNASLKALTEAEAAGSFVRSKTSQQNGSPQEEIRYTIQIDKRYDPDPGGQQEEEKH